MFWIPHVENSKNICQANIHKASIYIYIYIYIYILNNSPYGKKSGSDLKMKIYNESLSRGKKYIGKKYILEKKEKANLVIPIEKKSRDTQLVGQKKKNHRPGC